MIITHMPDDMAFVEAAGVMEAFVTAVEAVCHLARLERGQSVLIHAAAGGIGSACVQLAHALGVRVIATAGAGRLADVLAIGACEAFDYRAGDERSGSKPWSRRRCRDRFCGRR